MRVVLVHGFNIKDKGARTVDRLAPYFIKAGYEVDMDEADYGYFNLLQVRWVKKKIIYRLAKAFEKADLIVTHSNGANFATKALELMSNGTPTKLVAHISPALNTRTPIPSPVKQQLIMYTPNDGWVKLSSYLPAHRWGRMGARGYQGDQENNKNHLDKSVTKHSNWFIDAHVAHTFSVIDGFTKEYTL